MQVQGFGGGQMDVSGSGPVQEPPTPAELRAYVAVAEERHFSRAALRLGVAPPSLSRTIRRLEERLGAVLLERTPRSVVLTAAGEELLPRAREILHRMEDAQLAVTSVAHGGAGRFVIGVFSNGFAELTGPIIGAFRRAHPEVTVTLRDITANPMEMILMGVVDIALIRPPICSASDERLRLVHLIAEPRCVLAPAHHPLATTGEGVGIAEVLGYPFVSAIPDHPVISDHWAAADWRGGEPVRVGSEAWSIPDVLRGVGYLGNIVTSFPSILRFFRIPGVVTVPLIDMPDTTMAVAVRADIPNSALADDLTAAARLVAAELAYLIPGARALETTTPDAPGAAVRA